MSSREQHYAKVREALTDALSKIETDEVDDDDESNGNCATNARETAVSFSGDLKKGRCTAVACTCIQ